MRKPKAKLELNLAGDMKNNRKGFYKYSTLTRNGRSKKGYPLINNAGKMVTVGDKAKVLNNFFTSVLNGKQDGDWGSKVPPTVREGQVHGYLRNWNICKPGTQ